MKPTRRTIALLAMTMSACGLGVSSLGSPNSTGAAVTDRQVGTVQVVGSAPVNTQTVLRLEGGPSLGLSGDLAVELARLPGARVAVRGQVGPSPDPMVDGRIEVEDYEVLSIDGNPVLMGEIISITGGTARLQTPGGVEVELRSPPTGFRVGQKVWVQGPSSLVVQSYGIVRP